MRPGKRAAALVAGLAALATAVAAPAWGLPAVAEQVAVARRGVPALGVHVVELPGGETVVAHEPDRPRILASNTKLITTAAALDALGPGYLFETRLLARGPAAGGLLRGDLAVVGGGDPNISGRHFDGDPYAVFRRWAAALRGRGVSRVEGNLYLVHGLFDAQQVHPDWPRDQLSRWYEAPVGALSFNDNCVLVRVHPGARPGAPARVELVPEPPGFFRLRVSARTTASAKQHRVVVARAAHANDIVVSGSVYRGAAPVEAWVAVRDPGEYFGAALRAAWREEGLEVGGRSAVVEALPAGGWEQIAASRTDLLTTLEVTNKRSQNFYAESLFKLLGALLCGEGSWAGGGRAVDEFLERVGIARGSYSLADGSGMSRNGRFTPRQVTRLLEFMFSHTWGREFLLSLAHSGEPGLRWEKRLAEVPYRGNVFAKTGTLRGVSTLSGYAKARSGRLYAFSILCNGADAWRAQRHQDAIVRALIDQG
jgi:D-alanyl-D-alanine carboxypeptidase/D-alanyl-D-alanine-endopeptidase (penicillin-binding protein 4)